MKLDKQVSTLYSFNDDTIPPFKTGRLKWFQSAWSKITSDQWILKAIQGVEIEFLMKPFQLRSPKELSVVLRDALLIMKSPSY